MRSPSTQRKNTVRRAPTLGGVEEKECDDDDGDHLKPLRHGRILECPWHAFRDARRDADMVRVTVSTSVTIQ
jgi:hypothetical protein